jgi:cytochrome b pre-mRNA-processing protein 3
MSIISRLLGTQADPRDELRPLWFRVIELSRQPEYYARTGVADTVDGRFDMVVNVLAITMLRMESSSGLNRKSALLTELFVEDMDGQLRESGIGDVVVGKHMGRLMSALGGRLGALRSAITRGDMERLEAALERNVHWGAAPDPRGLAIKLRALYDDLATSSDEDLLAGRIAQ